MTDPAKNWAEGAAQNLQAGMDLVIINTLEGKKPYQYRRKCRLCDGVGRLMMHASLCSGYSNPCSCPFCGVGNCRNCDGTGKETLTRWRKPRCTLEIT